MNQDRALRDRRIAWEEAGRRNPLYYIATERTEWEIADFFASGENLLQERVDPWLRKMGRDPTKTTALEIGAGVGRLSRGLSNRFAQVIAVDISPSMVAAGHKLNADRPNLRFVVTAGNDLPGLLPESCDFVLCVWVFQHIPNLKTIEDYIAEIARVLSPNGSFLVQIQGSRLPWPYADVRNFLVRTGIWTKVLGLFNVDTTLAQAFPGALLGLRKLSQILQVHHLRIVETVRDENANGSVWVYGTGLGGPMGPPS